MMMRGRENVITRMITAYFPTVSVSTGGVYSKKLEDLTIMKIQNDPRTQLWIDLTTKIAKWVCQGEQLIVLGEME